TFGRRSMLCEADQAGDQRLRTADILADLGSEGPLRLGKRRAEEQVRVAEHGGNGIVEFMRYAADQLTNRSQFFRLQELGLQLFQTVERLGGILQELSQFSIEQVLSHEYHHAHE